MGITIRPEFCVSSGEREDLPPATNRTIEDEKTRRNSQNKRITYMDDNLKNIYDAIVLKYYKVITFFFFFPEMYTKLYLRARNHSHG